jgi:hypothetical protein
MVKKMKTVATQTIVLSIGQMEIPIARKKETQQNRHSTGKDRRKI